MTHPKKNQRPHTREPNYVKLTAEERAVLVECRRNSLARGIPLGFGALFIVRWLNVNDRLPSSVSRLYAFYYAGAFFGAFYIGLSSYKQTCMSKIMALENSFLKEQLLKATGKEQSKTSGGSDDKTTPSVPTSRASPSVPSFNNKKSYPPTAKTKIALDEGPRLKNNYEKDKRMLDTKVEDVDQPDAFGGSSSYHEEEIRDSTPKEQSRRGKSYDDIRRSSDRQSPTGRDYKDRSPKQQGRSVRKNKYGDDIEE